MFSNLAKLPENISYIFEYIKKDLDLSVFSEYILMAIIFNFILSLIAIIVITKDARKRNIKCLQWNLLTLLFGFIGIIIYILKCCPDKPNTPVSKKVIAMENNNEIS